MGLGERGRGLIVVDSSAVVAVFLRETGAERISTRLMAEPLEERRMSAANYVEAGVVLAMRSPRPSDGAAAVNAFLEKTNIMLAPLDDETARVALRARLQWGRGFGTRKGLNFGDSFAYATAKVLNAPLLYVGDDFGLTDIRSAL
jgi:ribonuclease VapC